MAGEGILIVEDESVVALNVAHTVESLGYRAVGPTATGVGALDLLDRERVDLVLMDIKLKGQMDGIELARRIIARGPLPIVFLTAYTDSRTLSRAKVAEPYGYITKSFDEGELHSTIEMALYKFEMERQLVKEERLLAATLGSIQEGVVTTDREGRVRYMNPAATRLLGIAFDSAEGMELDEVVSLCSVEGRRILPSEIAGDGAAASKRLDGTPLMVEVKGALAVPIEWKSTRISPATASDVESVHVIRDLSLRLEAEATQRRLISLVEFSDDAIITLTPEARIESWNSGALQIFGYNAEEAVGSELSVVVRGLIPLHMAEPMRRVLEGGSVDTFETVCLRKDGSPVDVAMKLQAIREPSGAVGSVSLIARDVSGRKNLDKKVREILNREQTRIGQDLHDSIGQMITGILFKSKALERRLAVKELQRESSGAAEIKELLTETLLKLREIARGLIPATIRADGLVHVLQKLGRDTELLWGVPVVFEANSEVLIGDELVSSELYHIVEEGLTNAVKHSRCNAVEIRVTNLPGEVIVSVRDDGRGLPKEGSGGGLGLKIMRHRAELIGASLTVASSRKGTEIVCRAPTGHREERGS